MTQAAERDTQAELDDWFEDTPTPSPEAKDGDEELPLPRETLRVSRPFPGIKELKAGRTNFFAELAEVVNLEVNRLLRYTMMTYAHPRCAEIEVKAEADANAATRDIMEKVTEYIDKCVQMLEESKDGSTVILDPSVEAAVLEKQLDESISQNQELLGKMKSQEGRIKKLNSMIKSMRVQYYKELESQKDRFRNIIHRYLPELSPEEMAELLQSVAAVQLFHAGDFMDEDTQLAVQQKVQAVEKDFNVEREALNRQIEILTESEAEARHRCALAYRRAEKLHYELTKLNGTRKKAADGKKEDGQDKPGTATSSAGESISEGPRPSLLELDLPQGRMGSGSVFSARRGSDGGASRSEMKLMMEKVHDVEKSKNELLMEVHATNDLVHKQKVWLESMPQTSEVNVLRIMMGDILAKTGSMQSSLEMEVKPPSGLEKRDREEALSKQAVVNDLKLVGAEKELLKAQNTEMQAEILDIKSKNAELQEKLGEMNTELDTTKRDLKKTTKEVEGLMEVEAPKTQTLKHANTTLRILKMLKWNKDGKELEDPKFQEMKSLNPQSIDETISELVMDEARRYTLDVDGLKRELEKAQKQVVDLTKEKQGWEQERFSFLSAAPASLDVLASTSGSPESHSPSGASRPTSSMFTKTARDSNMGSIAGGISEERDVEHGTDYFPDGRRKAVQFDSFGKQPLKDAGCQTWKPKRRDESTMAYPDRTHNGVQAGQPKGRKRNGPHDKNAVLEWDNQKDTKRGIEFAIQEAQETELRGLRSENARLTEKIEFLESQGVDVQALRRSASMTGRPDPWEDEAAHAERVHKEAERRRSMRLSDAELAEIDPTEFGKLNNNAKVLKKSNSKEVSPKTSLSIVLNEVVDKANLGENVMEMQPDMDLESAEEARRQEEQAIIEANRLIDGAAHELEDLQRAIEGDADDADEGMTPAQVSAYRVEQAKAMLKQAEAQMMAISQSSEKLSLWKKASSTVHVHQKLKNELRIEYEHCLIKKLNEERGRIYRAWPRVASAEPAVRQKVHQALGKRKTLELELANASNHVLDQRNEALARIDQARFITYGKESHLHLCANDARFEDLRDLLESQELFSHYECIGSLTRRLMACRGEFKRMRSRLAGALFESDRLRGELCLLREDYLKEKENVAIVWARQAYWLRRCISELGEKAKRLHIPHALLEKHLTKETAKTVLWEELANLGMAAGQAGQWEFERRMNRRKERVERHVVTEARHTMLEHQRRAYNMADSLFVFHKVQEDEPGTRQTQSILELPDVSKMVKDSKCIASGAAKELKSRLRTVDASDKTLEKKADIIIDVMDQVEEREQKVLNHYKESFDVEPGDGPPRRHLEETLEVAVKALQWLDLAEYRCSEGDVEAAAVAVADSSDDEGHRFRGAEEREEELRNNVAEHAAAALERAQKRWGSGDGYEDEEPVEDEEMKSAAGSNRSGRVKKKFKDAKGKLSITGNKKEIRMKSVIEAARGKKAIGFNEEIQAQMMQDTEEDRKAKENAEMLSALEPMEAAEKALAMDTNERGRAIAFMDTDKRTAILSALPLAIAAMPSKPRRSMRRAFHKIKTGQMPTEEEVNSDHEGDEQADPDVSIEDLMKAWGIGSDSEEEEEAAEGAEGAEGETKGSGVAKLKRGLLRKAGLAAKMKKKLQGLSMNKSPRSKSPVPRSPRSKSPMPEDAEGSPRSRPGTKGSGVSKEAEIQAAKEVVEERVVHLEEKLGKLKGMMQEDLEKWEEAKVMLRHQRDAAEAKAEQMELEISTLKSVMQAEGARAKDEAEAKQAEIDRLMEELSDSGGSSYGSSRASPEHKRKKKRRRKRDSYNSASPHSDLDGYDYPSYSESEEYSDDSEEENDREGPSPFGVDRQKKREKPRREKPKREKQKREIPEDAPRKGATTPRSERLPTPEGYSGEDQDEYFDEEGADRAQAKEGSGEKDEQANKEGVAREGPSPSEETTSPREKRRREDAKQDRKRREKPERRERPEKQDDRSERRRDLRRSKTEGPARLRRDDRSEPREERNIRRKEKQADEDDEEDTSRSPEFDGDVDEGEPSSPANKKANKLPAEGRQRRRQPGSQGPPQGAKRSPRGHHCPKCGANIEGLMTSPELESSPEPPSAPARGRAAGMQGIAKMKNKVTTTLVKKKANLDNLAGVMKTAMRQSKEMLVSAGQDAAFEAIREAQAVAEVAKGQIEKMDEDIDVQRDLEARKNASRLERLPPLEAAEAALNMDDEERGDAIGYMNAHRRKELLSALPQVILTMKPFHREELFKEVRDSREASRQSSRQASRQEARQASAQGSREASRESASKQQKGLEGEDAVNVDVVVAHITQQAEDAAEREKGMPDKVRETLKDINSLALMSELKLEEEVSKSGSKPSSAPSKPGTAQVIEEGGAEAAESFPPPEQNADEEEKADNCVCGHKFESHAKFCLECGRPRLTEDERARTASASDRGSGKDVQDSQPAPAISLLTVPDSAPNDADAVSEMNSSGGFSNFSHDSVTPPVSQGKSVKARPRPTVRAKPKPKLEESATDEVAIHAEIDPHGIKHGHGLTPHKSLHHSKPMWRMLKHGEDVEEPQMETRVVPQTAEAESQADLDHGLPWTEVPETLINWLKENLVQREQAEFYNMPKTVTEIQWFDLNVIQRDRILEDFEEFLREIMSRMQPVKKKKKKGDKDASGGDQRDRSASPRRDGARGRSPFTKPSPLNPQPFDEPAYDPYNWESTQRSLAQLQIDPNMAWLSLGGNRLMKISGAVEPLQEAASGEKPKPTLYPFFVQLDSNGIPLQKLPSVVSGRAPLENLLGTTSREMDNLDDGYIGIPEGAIVLVGPAGVEYRPVRLLTKPTPSPDEKNPDAKETDLENPQVAADGETAEADKERRIDPTLDDRAVTWEEYLSAHKEQEPDGEQGLDDDQLLANWNELKLVIKEKEKEGDKEADKEKEQEQEEDKEPKEKPKPSTGETRAGLQQLINAFEQLYARNMRNCLDRMKPPTVLPRRMDGTEIAKAQTMRLPRNPWRGRSAVRGLSNLASTGPAQPTDQYVGCVSWNYKRQESQPAAEPEPEDPVVQHGKVKEPWTQAKAETLIRSLVTRESGSKKLIDARQPGLPTFWPQPRKGASVGAKYEDTVKSYTEEGFTRSLMQTSDSSSPNKKPAGAGTPNPASASPPATRSAGESGFDDAGIGLSAPFAAGWKPSPGQEKISEGVDKAALPQIHTPRYGHDVKGPVRGLKTAHEGGRWGGTG